MKEVTKEEFFRIIDTEKLDVCISVAGNYPFTDYFEFRNGAMITVRHWNNSKDYHGCAEYIHELQQAIRLCGIDKRIEL